MQSPDIVDTALRQKTAVSRARGSLFWCLTNTVGACSVLFAMFTSEPSSDKLNFTWYIQLIVFVILLSNAVTHLVQKVGTVWREPVTVSPQQRQLLAVRDSDCSFVTRKLSPVAKSTPQPVNITELLSSLTPTNSITPVNMSNNSWMSSPNESVYFNVSASPNESLNSSSWIYCQARDADGSYIAKEATPIAVEGPRHRRCRTAPPRILFPGGFSYGPGERSLQYYLNSIDREEKQLLSESLPQTGHNKENALMNLSGSSFVTDLAFGKPQYMLSVPMSGNTRSMGSPTDDLSNISSIKSKTELWQKAGVNPDCIMQWTQNLRSWLSQTVLSRLVVEIQNVNESLERLGFPDTQIGQCSLEKLKKAVQNQQINAQVPTLRQLIPFLDLSIQQEYVVGRVQELSRGGCMGDYHWNTGGTFKGQQWNNTFPTDGALIMHLFSSYLDACLPAPPSPYPESRPFTSQYFLKAPEKPDEKRNKTVIYQTHHQPPHFKLSVDGQLVEVAQGPNNLFHAILLFFHHMKEKENGMLGRMNLGPSGINVLCIFK